MLQFSFQFVFQVSISIVNCKLYDANSFSTSIILSVMSSTTDFALYLVFAVHACRNQEQACIV